MTELPSFGVVSPHYTLVLNTASRTQIIHPASNAIKQARDPRAFCARHTHAHAAPSHAAPRELLEDIMLRSAGRARSEKCEGLHHMSDRAVGNISRAPHPSDKAFPRAHTHHGWWGPLVKYLVLMVSPWSVGLSELGFCHCSAAAAATPRLQHPALCRCPVKEELMPTSWRSLPTTE